MKCYLAARYSRREELKGYAEDLQAAGIEVTSRWLSGAHDTLDDEAATSADQRAWAEEDLANIDRADVLVAFTEESGTGPSRGGRHVEFGYALAKGKTILFVGDRENVFFNLRQVAQFDEWADALHQLWFLKVDHANEPVLAGVAGGVK